ncbi:hypothetical protein P7K49_033113 [Saguinus oedipus]|uniref:Uncharacterized protein n=1 Tax=Saguinus oedipus TaxID=9490 RepID=A0ABQ9TQZ9_SAGOE|nr:hypothetical protein P7K49_033113 [Saguinus oedipus]
MNPKRSRKSGGQYGSHFSKILSELVRMEENLINSFSPGKFKTKGKSQLFQYHFRPKDVTPYFLEGLREGRSQSAIPLRVSFPCALLSVNLGRFKGKNQFCNLIIHNEMEGDATPVQINPHRVSLESLQVITHWRDASK